MGSFICSVGLILVFASSFLQVSHVFIQIFIPFNVKENPFCQAGNEIRRRVSRNKCVSSTSVVSCRPNLVAKKGKAHGNDVGVDPEDACRCAHA